MYLILYRVDLGNILKIEWLLNIFDKINLLINDYRK